MMNVSFFPADDFVMVGHVSMNKKRAKKKLQKIAHVNAQTMGLEQPAGKWPANKKNGQRQNRNSNTRKHASMWIEQSENVVTNVVAELAVEVPEVVPSMPEMSTNTFVAGLQSCDESLLAQIFSFAGHAAIGAVATTCSTAHSSVWGTTHFWTFLAGKGGLDVHNAFSYRQWYFGLESGWCQRFARDAELPGNALDVLERAAFMAGGVTCFDRSDAALFVSAVRGAMLNYDGTDFDEGLDLVESLARKMERRPEVFSLDDIAEIDEIHEDLAERRVMTQLLDERENDAFDFNYFEDDDGTDKFPGLPNEDGLDLAAEFFDALSQ